MLIEKNALDIQEKMNPTNIEWVKNPDGSRGSVWNPITGCNHDCYYCYAKGFAKRLQGKGNPAYKNGFEPTFHPKKLQEPYKAKKPTKVFVGSMADVFGSWVPTEYIIKIFKVVEDNPRHTFIFLTKNPGRYHMPKLIHKPDNAWFGVSATDQYMFDVALDALYEIECKIRFISVEPFLEKIVFPTTLIDLQWLIMGSKTGRKPFKPPIDWVKELTIHARELEIPVFHKDNLSLLYHNKLQEFPIIKESKHGQSKRC